MKKNNFHPFEKLKMEISEGDIIQLKNSIKLMDKIYKEIEKQLLFRVGEYVTISDKTIRNLYGLKKKDEVEIIEANPHEYHYTVKFNGKTFSASFKLFKKIK